MNIIDKMKSNENRFTKKEKQIYNLITDDIRLFCDNSKMIIERNNISQSSLTRFCQKLGYSGLNEFRYELINYSIGGPINEDTISNYSSITNKIEMLFTKEKFQPLINEIRKAERIFTFGSHKSYLAAMLLLFDLVNFGYSASFVRFEDSYIYLPHFSKNDLLIFFSISSAKNIGKNIKVLNNMSTDKPKTVLITLSESHPLKSEFDYCYIIPSNRLSRHHNEPMLSYSVFINLLSSYL